MGVRDAELKHLIDTELSPGNLRFLLEYIRRHYMHHRERFRAYRMRITIESDGSHLFYRIVVPKTRHYLDVQVDATIPVNVTLRLSDPSIPTSFIEQFYEDLFLIV